MDGLRTFEYDSVYFDTPQLDSYLLAARGRRRRFKIRTRTYVDSAASFLEVKTEGGREATVKERIPYGPADRSRITAEGLAYVNDTLAAAVGAVPAGPLGPVLETRYRRTTLFLPGSGSRATLDEARHLAAPGADPLAPGPGPSCSRPSRARRPGPLDRHLWANGIRPSRISKFATGMAALCPELPANRWHSTLGRSLQLTPAPPA